MRRHDWSCQVPVRQALERDEGGRRGMEGRGVARDKRVARDLGACLCFEDEAGQGLRPPRLTWAPRGARPAVRVRGAGAGG